MGREKVEQVLWVPKREGWEPKANPNERQEVPRLAVLPIKVWACPYSNIPQAIRTVIRRSLLVVRKDGPNSGTSLPPLQEMEERAARTTESSPAGDRLESGKVQASANIGAILPKDARSSGDRLPVRRAEVAAVFLSRLIHV
jgi:hypothetical protein